MKHIARGLAGLALAALVGGAALSASHVSDEIKAAVAARQAHMKLNGFNIAPLGGMAKGAIPYDAAVASAAAANLAALASMDQSRYWPPGSDRETIGEMTRALRAAWEPGSKAEEINMKLAAATANLAAEAGKGLDALRAAIGPVGQACGSCHKAYRSEK